MIALICVLVGVGTACIVSDEMAGIGLLPWLHLGSSHLNEGWVLNAMS
jgi:hypothetical protein